MQTVPEQPNGAAAATPTIPPQELLASTILNPRSVRSRRRFQPPWWNDQSVCATVGQWPLICAEVSEGWIHKRESCPAYVLPLWQKDGAGRQETNPSDPSDARMGSTVEVMKAIFSILNGIITTTISSWVWKHLLNPLNDIRCSLQHAKPCTNIV